MKQYGLRAFAGNFSPDELREAVAFAHAHGVRFYVTMNVLPTDADMPGFLSAAKTALKAGVDAAIVSDTGAALMLGEEVPALRCISARRRTCSTRAQLCIFTARWARSASCSRVSFRSPVLPPCAPSFRLSWSWKPLFMGRCAWPTAAVAFLAPRLRGAAATRGACAQPCRWKYHVAEEKRPGEYLPVCEDENGAYLFSAGDLCMLPHLPALRDAGIHSLKIEGRMKTAYYVATVVSAYRRALDVLEARERKLLMPPVPGLLDELAKASHRQSNTGFYFGAPRPVAGAEGFTQTMEYVGDVVEDAAAGAPALVRLKNRFYTGDELEVLTPSGPKPFVAGGLRLAATGETVQTASVAGTLLYLSLPFSVGAGDLLRGPNRNHKPT